MKFFALPAAVRYKTLGSYEIRTEPVLDRAFGAVPFGFTGIIAGFLTGSSRAPAVSALVPAILTFAGLLVVFTFDKSRLKSVVANFAVFVFSASLLVGTILGSASRDRHEDMLQSLPVQTNLAEREFLIRRAREKLGLPPAPPPKEKSDCPTKD